MVVLPTVRGDVKCHHRDYSPIPRILSGDIAKGNGKELSIVQIQILWHMGVSSVVHGEFTVLNLGHGNIVDRNRYGVDR